MGFVDVYCVSMMCVFCFVICWFFVKWFREEKNSKAVVDAIIQYMKTLPEDEIKIGFREIMIPKINCIIDVFYGLEVAKITSPNGVYLCDASAKRLFRFCDAFSKKRFVKSLTPDSTTEKPFNEKYIFDIPWTCTFECTTIQKKQPKKKRQKVDKRHIGMYH